MQKVVAPRNMAWHISTAKASKDAAEYIEKARAAPYEVAYTSPKTREWFAARYQTGFDLFKDVQKFVDDAKAGIFDIEVLRFKSAYLGKAVYIRAEDLARAKARGHETVKYCKPCGGYHVDRTGAPPRLVALANLDGVAA